jgi:hypothetical protein
MRKKDESRTELAEMKFIRSVKGYGETETRIASRNKDRSSR